MSEQTPLERLIRGMTELEERTGPLSWEARVVYIKTGLEKAVPAKQMIARTVEASAYVRGHNECRKLMGLGGGE